MKATVLRVMSILALVIGLTVISAQAQTILSMQKFTVPFEFHVGNEVLPAGEYVVLVENQTIRVRRNDGKANAIALSIRAGHTSSEVKLTFRQYGDQLYLSQVWLADGIGRELKIQRRRNTDIAQTFSVVEVQGR